MPTIVLVSDKFDRKSESPVEVRVHSECMTGDVFSSSRCDCGAQLDTSLLSFKRRRYFNLPKTRGEGELD